MMCVSLTDALDETQRTNRDNVEPLVHSKKLYINYELLFLCEDPRLLRFQFYHKFKLLKQMPEGTSKERENEVEEDAIRTGIVVPNESKTALI